MYGLELMVLCPVSTRASLQAGGRGWRYAMVYFTSGVSLCRFRIGAFCFLWRFCFCSPFFAFLCRLLFLFLCLPSFLSFFSSFSVILSLLITPSVGVGVFHFHVYVVSSCVIAVCLAFAFLVDIDCICICPRFHQILAAQVHGVLCLRIIL